MSKYISLIIAFVLYSTGNIFSQSVVSVEKVTITVSDLEQAVDFYTQVLDFNEVRKYELNEEVTQQIFGFESKEMKTQVAVLRLGSETIELMEFSGSHCRNIPADSRSNDLWFQHIAIVVSDMDKAYKRVFDAKATHISTAPQTLPDYIPAAAGITAFYFRDRDGHNLELIHYPKGKGNPKWQSATEGPLFLGIDHTAIGIDDTDRGLQFYQELLAMQVAGNSENFGSEQEHLNQVFGARLLITGLQASRGFGVEFLDYIAPPGGRAYPADSTPADLWHWHTTLSVSKLDELRDRLIKNGYALISKGIVTHDGNKMIAVRDPDGHALLLVESQQVPPNSM